MAVAKIRDVNKKMNLWGGFKDELVATSMTLSLLVLGSFLLTERAINPPTDSQKIDTVLESVAAEAVIPEPPPVATMQPQTLGLQDPPTRNASEGSVVMSEVPYGQDGDYDISSYAVSFRSPRVTFDAKTNTKRKLVVNVWVKNKTIAAGLTPRLTASIIKDGVVIVPQAALHILQGRTLGVGEEVSFSASISLIEGTDIRELKFKPGNEEADTSHFLYP